MASTFQLSLLLSLFISVSVAHAKIIQVEGPTYQLPNIIALKTVDVQLSQAQIQQLAQKTTSLQPAKGGFQPLDTTLKSCIDFQSKRVNISHLPRPLFVVSDDQASLAWLKKYKPILEKINAIGLVITAKDINSLKKIRKVAGHLALYPVKGNAVQKRFGIPCYPVLISKHEIEH